MNSTGRGFSPAFGAPRRLRHRLSFTPFLLAQYSWLQTSAPPSACAGAKAETRPAPIPMPALMRTVRRARPLSCPSMCLLPGSGRLLRRRLFAGMIAERRRRRQVGGGEMRAFRIIGVAALAAAACLFASASNAQQDWPNRPVRVVVPFGAGGSADRLVRIAADHLWKTCKQEFYIESRVGAERHHPPHRAIGPVLLGIRRGSE